MVSVQKVVSGAPFHSLARSSIDYPLVASPDRTRIPRIVASLSNLPRSRASSLPPIRLHNVSRVRSASH